MALLSLSSCSEFGSEIIYDISPIELYIYLTDEGGDNLLDTPESGIDVGKILITYDGKTYSPEIVETKAYFPIFYGLRLTSDTYGNSMLTFGELDGSEDIDNSDVVINWGDGTSDTITIFNKCRLTVSGKLNITRRFYVNGKKTESDIARFVFVK